MIELGSRGLCRRQFTWLTAEGMMFKSTASDPELSRFESDDKCVETTNPMTCNSPNPMTCNSPSPMTCNSPNPMTCNSVQLTKPHDVQLTKPHDVQLTDMPLLTAARCAPNHGISQAGTSILHVSLKDHFPTYYSLMLHFSGCELFSVALSHIKPPQYTL
ncbi:hypothetical protein BaRGS_00012673 [Batillaria attramentaria]|uniref:Uncharacterized protein n=1 Tax=Batillaria attramentaria TaxID=370345 RepID=A0ABD0LA05_9CAEN